MFSDKFDLETDRVLLFNYRGHGPGGELPTVSVRVLPADRADSVLKLDDCIQKAKRYAPWASLAASVVIFIAALML